MTASAATRVALVTDSTACLPDDVVRQHGILVVPLQVVIGDRAVDEGTGGSQETVARALRSFQSVSTSRPAPEVFRETYRKAVAAGAEAIVSVHLSASLSGTYDSAVAAAADAGVDVEVVDTAQIGLATGFAVLAAARALAAGADAGTAATAACDRADACASYFYVDTLEYLQRGGRIGAAAALVGAALAVKPLLTVRDGEVQLLEKVRTAGRALARIEELAVEAAGAGPVYVAVQHLRAPARAAQLTARLRQRLPKAEVLWEQEVTAVIGAHVGPGAVAVVVSPEPG